MSCLCGDRGILKIQYETGEPFDIAICRCPRGLRLRVWHVKHPTFIAEAWQIDPGHHRIAYLEDFEDTVEPAPQVGAHYDAAYMVAGQVEKKARR